MAILRLGKRRVVPFLNKEKAKKYAHRGIKKGYPVLGIGKRNGIYWVALANRRKIYKRKK